VRSWTFWHRKLTHNTDTHFLLIEAEKNQILRWLVVTDPSPNHNSACQIHEFNTGQWLTNSPEYTEWISGRSQFLWLHGIPGAGKTVLHSYIAEEVVRICEEMEDSACAFYYCYFARNQDETQPFLRWVIKELSRKLGRITSEVCWVYSSNNNQLGPGTLLSILEAVAGHFSQVYITIDALDESAERETLLQTLQCMVENPKLRHIRLLATSRKELDIERALSPLATELSLSNPYVDDDIRVYIKSRLLEAKFSRWPESLKDEMENALVKGAKGMWGLPLLRIVC
jgi:Cdc6-like AAA superfamily ATPase